MTRTPAENRPAATATDTATTSATAATSARQRNAATWTREKVSNLIQLYRQKECLWNHFHEEYKNKETRERAIKDICTKLQISKFDYAKKIHNLRNQFNSELKLLERRLSEADDSIDEINIMQRCRWEHFAALMFLRNIITRRPGGNDGHDSCSQPKKICVKLDYADEASSAAVAATTTTNSFANAENAAETATENTLQDYDMTEYHLTEIAESEDHTLPDEVIISDDELADKHNFEETVYTTSDLKTTISKPICDSNAKPFNAKLYSISKATVVTTPEQQTFEIPATATSSAAIIDMSPLPSQNSTATITKATTNEDQWSDFGRFVANELRNLQSDFCRKKLKLKIMNALLEVETEDFERSNGKCFEQK